MGSNHCAGFHETIVWRGWRVTLETLADYARSRVEPGDVFHGLFSEEELNEYDIRGWWPFEDLSRNDLQRLLQWENELEESAEFFHPKSPEGKEVIRKDLISLREKTRKRIAQLSNQRPE